MRFEHHQRMDPRIQAIHAPFQVTRGIEVLEKMSEVDGETSTSLQSYYLKKRKRLMSPPYEKVLVDGAIGRSQVAKGSFLMGLQRVIHADGHLQDWLERKGLELETVSVTFSLATVAAGLQGISSRVIEQGHQTEADFRAISAYMSEMMEEHIFSRPRDGKIVWVFYESGAFSSYPISGRLPIEVAGVDRGNSPLYNLMVDPRTRRQTDVFVIEKDVQTEAVTREHRAKFDPEARNFSDVFARDMEYVLTNAEGEQINVLDLSLEEQRRIVSLMKVASAPPAAKLRSDADVDERLRELGLSTDREYAEFIRDTLKPPKGKFHFINNDFFYGNKTYDLDYLYRNNLFMTLQPDLAL